MATNQVYFSVAVTQLVQSGDGVGFVDNLKVEDYMSLSPPQNPTDLASSQEKERANMRWLEILQQISTTISPIDVVDIVATGADVDTPPTQFSFGLVYDRVDYLYADDETNPGTQLTGVDAIKRWVARALTNNFVSNRLVMDPTPLQGVTGEYGPSIQSVTAGPAAADIATAEAAITVTQVTI